MLCVWSMSDDVAKCRACVCGNFSQVDPTEQSWTAQAEPSSLMASLKLGRKKNWTISKHDVKGAFLNAKVPEGKVIIVSPPPQWVAWGLVDKGVLWTLDKAVYGLRESPKWWGDCRDKTLRGLAWDCGGRNYYLQQCSSDTQMWTIRELGDANGEVLGTLAVYVDGLLL